jgi:ABC-type antimicrobial peptide transport system permease subunit
MRRIFLVIGIALVVAATAATAVHASNQANVRAELPFAVFNPCTGEDVVFALMPALSALFAGLALAVAATGLYGVLSHNVSERRREIGIRAALGATRGRLMRLVLRQGLGFTLAGLALGLMAAAATSRLLSTLLFGVTPFDSVAFAVAPAVLILVALAACLVPAWRAAATDPVVALRAE